MNTFANLTQDEIEKLNLSPKDLENLKIQGQAREDFDAFMRNYCHKYPWFPDTAYRILNCLMSDYVFFASRNI